MDIEKTMNYRSITKFFQLENGRKLAFDEYGDLQGRPLFYFHGTPGSRLEAIHAHEAALKHGFYIIAFDRPGIGWSDYQPGRVLLDWAKDIVAMADTLGLETFGVMGASGGGPPLLACAYSIPERLDYAVDLAGFSPADSAIEEMGALDRFFARLSTRMPLIFRVSFFLMGSVAIRFPKRFFKFIGDSLCEADKKVLEDPEMASLIMADIQESFRQGARGAADDALLCYRDWGFKVEEISVPVHIFHGTADKLVPYSFSEYLVEAIPTTTLHPYPDEGHFVFYNRFDEIFEFISTC